jgi:hypothetical protein
MNFKKYIWIGPSVLILLLANCKSENKKCTYGDPQAIFSDTMKQVKKHYFEIKDKTGVELVVLANGMQLEIEQSGCHEINQQFTFILNGDFSKMDDNFWKTLAIENFNLLSNASPKLIPFQAWSSAIQSVKESLKLSESVEVEKNTFVRIDKILGQQKPMLVVQLSQKKSEQQ